jgi:hypothetical protein
MPGVEILPNGRVRVPVEYFQQSQAAEQQFVKPGMDQGQQFVRPELPYKEVPDVYDEAEIYG